MELCMSDIIKKKRDGQELSSAEINWFITSVVKKDGNCDDAQLGALLMAIFLKGMSNYETKILTSAMMHSGDILDWPDAWRGKLVDKHSTGGVGDKVSLALAPALAACGMKVPMISGRGLGHTGGTLDKLESIPGYNVNFEHGEMIQILENVGCCIVGQTDNLVKADKILYATRDVTSTVASDPLIAGSIISKKAAEKLDSLILDVKCGKAAFKKTVEDAKKLAKTLVNASWGQDIKTIALLTKMDNPIGYTIGNALEVAEVLQCMHGHGPDDLVELVCHLGGHLLALNDSKISVDKGKQQIGRVLCNGDARRKFQQQLIHQGVTADLAQRLCANCMKNVDDVWTELDKADQVTDLQVATDGYVESIDAFQLACVAQKLGAGRVNASDTIDHSVGIRLFVNQGSKVKAGDTWIRVYHKKGEIPASTIASIENSLLIRNTQVPKTSRIIEVVTKD